MATPFPCNFEFLKIRDIPCECQFPILQCCVDSFPLLPTDPPEDLRNGDVYVVKDTLIPYFFWNGSWYPFTSGAAGGDADWFVEGVGGPDYGLGLNTDKAYHEAPIAINRTSARGASSLDVNGQIVADGVIDQIPNVPISGIGTRFMWMPEMGGALRAGYVIGTEWDNANIGLHSIALGQRSVASGDNSVALGAAHIASGDTSFAANQGNVASSDHTFSAGAWSSAGHFAARGHGFYANASGPLSVATGTETNSAGDHSWLHGARSNIFSDHSFVVGYRLELEATANRTVLFGHEDPHTVGVPIKFAQEHAFITYNLRPFIWMPSSAPIDANIKNNTTSMWIDEPGSQLVLRVRDSSGTLKTGTIALV